MDASFDRLGGGGGGGASVGQGRKKSGYQNDSIPAEVVMVVMMEVLLVGQSVNVAPETGYIGGGSGDW